MKKFKLFAFSVFVALFAIVNVNAEDTIQDLAQLKACLSSDVVVCTIGADIEADDTILVGGSDVTLDLNGHTISLDVDTYENTIILVQHGAKLTIKDSSGNDSGKLSYITDLTTDEVRTAIKLTKSKGDNTKTAELIVNGGTIEGDSYAISGNGNPGRDNTKTTINGGKLYSKATAIFQPQAGELIVNGGTIEGKTGIEVRSGKLTVNGGTIIGTAKPLESEKNGNGTTTVGAGLAVVQHTTTLEISIIINGGEFKGFTPLYQDSIEVNSNSELVSLAVTDGDFVVINEGETALYSGDKTGFITGGTYSTDVTKYVAAGLVSKKVGDNYNVGKENKINVSTATNGTIVADKKTAVIGESVAITATPSDGYKLSAISVLDKNGKEVELVDNSFVMPNEEVTISVSFIKTTTSVELPKVDTKEEPEEVIVGVSGAVETEKTLLESLESSEEILDKVKNENVTVGVEVVTIDEKEIDKKVIDEIKKVADNLTVTDFFDISVVVRSEEKEVDTIAELTKEIELMILLPEALKNTDKDINRKYYVIREHDGKIQKLDADLSEDGKYLTFKSDKFSTYALAYEDIEVEDEIKEELPPKTGDNVITYLLIAIMSLVAFAGTGMFLKKNYNK